MARLMSTDVDAAAHASGDFDTGAYLPSAAAAVCATSMSLAPAPLTATAPTISPSEKSGKPPSMVTNESVPAANVIARA